MSLDEHVLSIQSGQGCFHGLCGSPSECAPAAITEEPARRPYVLGEGVGVHVQLSGSDGAADFVRLKHILAHMGCRVPTLYKEYTEVAEPAGVHFLDFGVDPDLAHCGDGVVSADVQRLKPHKRVCYIGAVATPVVESD